MLSRYIGPFSTRPIEKQCVTTINATISPNILEERKEEATRGKTLGNDLPDKHNLRIGPGELTFTRKHAAVFESQKQGKRRINAFTSFTGISYDKDTTQEQFEDEFALMGVTTNAVLFEDDSNSNTGFPIQTSGSCTITNNSKSTLDAGQFVTWERPLKDISTSSQDRADRVVSSKHMGQIAPLFITDITDVFPSHARIASKSGKTKITSQDDLIAKAHKRQIMKTALSGVVSALEHGIIIPQSYTSVTPSYRSIQGNIGSSISTQQLVGAQLDKLNQSIYGFIKKDIENMLFQGRMTPNNINELSNRTSLITSYPFFANEKIKTRILSNIQKNLNLVIPHIESLNENFYEFHFQLFDKPTDYDRYFDLIIYVEYIILLVYLYLANSTTINNDLLRLLNDLINYYYRSCRYYLKHLYKNEEVNPALQVIIQLESENSLSYMENEETPATLCIPIGFFVLRALMASYKFDEYEKAIPTFVNTLYPTFKLFRVIDTTPRSTLFQSSVELLKRIHPRLNNSRLKVTIEKEIFKNDIQDPIKFFNDYQAIDVKFLPEIVEMITIQPEVRLDNEKFDKKYPYSESIAIMEFKTKLEKDYGVDNYPASSKEEISKMFGKMIVNAIKKQEDAMIDTALSSRQSYTGIGDQDTINSIIKRSYNIDLTKISKQDKTQFTNAFRLLQESIFGLIDDTFKENNNIVLIINNTDDSNIYKNYISVLSILKELYETISIRLENIESQLETTDDIAQQNIKYPSYQLGIITPVRNFTEEEFTFLKSKKSLELIIDKYKPVEFYSEDLDLKDDLPENENLGPIKILNDIKAIYTEKVDKLNYDLLHAKNTFKPRSEGYEIKRYLNDQYWIDSFNMEDNKIIEVNKLLEEMETDIIDLINYMIEKYNEAQQASSLFLNSKDYSKLQDLQDILKTIEEQISGGIEGILALKEKVNDLIDYPISLPTFSELKFDTLNLKSLKSNSQSNLNLSIPLSSSTTQIMPSPLQNDHFELSKVLGLTTSNPDANTDEDKDLTKQINASSFYGYISRRDRELYSGIDPKMFDDSKLELPVDSLGRPKLEHVSTTTQLNQLYHGTDMDSVVYLYAADVDRIFQRSFAMVTRTTPSSYPVDVVIR